jgi:dTDP-4-dehydrorhamnose reductase
MKSKPSLLVTGAGGMLGNAFVRQQSQLKQFFSKITFAYHEQLDLTNSDKVINFLNQLLPDTIINCAAMTIVENCENFPEKALQINAKVPHVLAKWTRKNRKKLVHYSTDAVFDGKRGNYRETDKTNPLNVYAKTKLAGEKLVLATDPDALILRTNIIGLRNRKPYPLAEWMLKKLEAKEEFTTFTDVFFAPLCVDDLVKLTLIALNKNLSGLYHLNAKNHVTKHQFALMLAKEFGLPTKLKPVKSSEILAVTRPQKTYLNSQKFSRDTGVSLPTVRQSIHELAKIYSS